MNETNRRNHNIDMEPLFLALRQPLALVEDERSRAVLEAFMAAARVHQERAAIDLVAQVVAFVNAGQTDARLLLEYQPQGPVLVQETNVTNEAADSLARMEGDTDKVTIRLPAELKQRAEALAAATGVSLNTWYVWALARVASRWRGVPVGPGGRDNMRGRGPHGGRRGGRGGPFAPPPAPSDRDYA